MGRNRAEPVGGRGGERITFGYHRRPPARTRARGRRPDLRAAAPAADPGSKYGGLATFGYLLKQGNSLYQLKKHTRLHPASRRFRGAIFEEAGPLGIGILLVQQVAKCS